MTAKDEYRSAPPPANRGPSLGPRRLRIPPGARVLEVGSGGRPHSRATVLCDRFISDASHREGRALIRDARPLVLADGEALPFRDHAFDYCVCMHVLEHVADPPRFLAELQRVARAGYIETPTELFDWMFSVPPYPEVHLWYVEAIAGELHIARKQPGHATHRFAHLLDHLRRTDPHFERWLEKSPHLFTTQHEWSGTIRYRMLDAPLSLALHDDPAAQAWMATRPRGARGFYWGSGAWGLKRWAYSAIVHPTWRQWAKRAASALRRRH